MRTKEEKAVYHKKWQAANPEKKKAAVMKWRAENPEKNAAIFKKWQDSNPEKYAASQKASSAKQVENLSDSYVSSQLSKRKGINQTAAQLREYPEIIECFRAIMKLRRLCRTKKKEKL